jgi:hypothetical protein
VLEGTVKLPGVKNLIFEDESGFHFYRMIHGNPPDQLGEPDFHFLKL